jgi:Zn-dependent M28 family amino/carboxypeptidase
VRRSRSSSIRSAAGVLTWLPACLWAGSPPQVTGPTGQERDRGRSAATAPGGVGGLGRHPTSGAPSPDLSPAVRRALEGIRDADILAHAKVLGDPKYRGREASTPGARKAAVYIAEEFRRASLRPGGRAGSYYQVFKIRTGYRIQSDLDIRVGGTSLGEQRLRADYAVLRLPDGKTDLNVPCALAGYGISCAGLRLDEYAGLDVKGKAVVVFSGVPWSASTGRWLQRTLGNPGFGTVAYKARNAADHGAGCLIIVDNPAGWRKQVGLAEQIGPTDTDVSADAPIAVVHITRDTMVKLTGMSQTELHLLALEIGQEMKPQSMLLRGRRLVWKAAMTGHARIGRNIIGILPGRDDKLRREAVVVGAHYDHLGEGATEEIYFGANDNAAGVGAMLSVARAFAALPQPAKRTIIFVAFDAEEVGRRGSKHYVSKPPLPIAHTAAMINFDMIGRNEPNGIYAVGTRSSPEVHEIHQHANRHVGLKLAHPESFRLGRSDHSPFYFAGVPILYLFGGLDPDYNTPRDTWDKLIPGKVEKVARLAFLTALEIAQRTQRPRFHNAKDAMSGLLPE